MNLDHDFVQVWKFSEDQKKNANRTLFSPNSGEDQKKRSSPKIEHFFSPILGKDQKKKGLQQEKNTFSPNLRSAVHPFKLLGGCRSEPFSNYWGDTAKLLGGIYPLHPPRVSAPLIESLLLARLHIFHSHNVVKKTTTLFCCKQCRRPSNRSVRGH